MTRVKRKTHRHSLSPELTWQSTQTQKEHDCSSAYTGINCLPHSQNCCLLDMHDDLSPVRAARTGQILPMYVLAT